MKFASRSSIRVLLLFLLAARLPAVAVHAQTQPRRPEAPRTTIDLDPDWRFIKEDAPGAEAPAFDDSAWTAVSLPHTWNNLDGETAGAKYYRGVGWYRRHLDVPLTLTKQRSLFLRFDGAATVTDVFVNGTSVGEHRGNFAAFCFDVTSLLHPGSDNVIAVKVNNAHDKDIAPLSGDFTVFGGLYRPVTLLALNPVSITPLDDAGPGVYVKQAKVSDRSADLEMTTKLRNATAETQKVSVDWRIFDEKGRIVEQGDSKAKDIDAHGTRDDIAKFTIRAPHLWNGVEDPYLYHIVVEVLDDKKRVLDSIAQPLGLRSFQVDPDTGLILNGKHYALHGVNRHQDRLDKGWAISDADHREDFSLIREMGSTGIRLSHYQHAQTFYDACDAGGLVVWAEIPLINTLTYDDAFAANAREQLTCLIKQNYNHPSILFWSLFNELHFPSKTPNPQEWALVGQLNDLAHQLDSTRLTTAASSLGFDHPVGFITDVIAFNRYPGWYGGKPTDWAKMLDGVHAKYPKRAIGISEYGAGAGITQHESLPPKQPKPTGKWHPEEWQSVVHEDAWIDMKSRTWLWGTFLWSMFDFGVNSRNEGDTPGRNDKGMVTYDRKTRKDAFYWYQANWRSAPLVHITSARYSPRPAVPSTVKLYSNCDTVELFLNGKSLGPKTGENHIFLYDAVPLAVGSNVLTAKAVAKGITASDGCTWIGVAAPPVTAAAAPAGAPAPPTSAPNVK